LGDNFGTALRELRSVAGISLRSLGKLAHCSHGYLADLEAGRRRPGHTLAKQLDVILKADGRLAALAPDADDGGSFSLRSHKFVVSHLSADCSPDVLADLVEAHTVAGYLPGQRSARVAHPVAGECDLHLWDHGVVIHHLVEDVTHTDLGSLARWRYSSYERDQAWAGQVLSEQLQREVTADYVLSVYWVTEPAWQGSRLETALRLICMPRVLVGDGHPDGDCSDVEHALLRVGFDHHELMPFGAADAAIGYASWSGVVYRPLDAERALQESDLVQVELATQSLWSHCSWLARQIEDGTQPSIPSDHGWLWLRGARSRLFTSRPQETGPHRSMREAILTTSGLPAMLDEALITLKELAP
jgi:transcriptional regulator with XRE-family HTH domain